MTGGIEVGDQVRFVRDVSTYNDVWSFPAGTNAMISAISQSDALCCVVTHSENFGEIHVNMWVGYCNMVRLTALDLIVDALDQC